ncbi:MAG: flagellar filament capping protein FliD [Magnetococcales bacterium]|nr:flagellar filament capping protein FliD [Magnetococcales bacterium]
MSVGSVTFGGLASGLPADIVSQLMEAQTYRLDAMEDKEDTYNDQKDAFSELETLLKTLETTSSSLQAASTFTPHTSTSSDTDTIAVSADSDASESVHTISVENLATNQTAVMAIGGDAADPNTGTGVADGAEVVTDGTTTFTFDYNGTTYDISASLTDGDGLTEIASYINELDFSADGDGVVASVMSDGTNERLVLTAQDSGENSGAQRITNITLDVDFDTDGDATGDVTLSTGDFANGIDAEDAEFTVDGVSVTSTSNSVSDVIEGVTLTLLDDNSGAGTADVTISVSNDTSSLTSTLDSFVSAYNSVIEYINSEKEGAFSGESLTRSIISQMRSVLNTSTSLDDGSGDDLSPYSMLAEIGLRTDSEDGTISFDSSTLSDVLSDNFEAVAAIFTNSLSDGDAGNEGVAHRMADLMDAITDYTDGSLTGRLDGIEDRLDSIADQIEREEERLITIEERMTLKFASLEQLVNSMNGAAGSLESTIASLQA